MARSRSAGDARISMKPTAANAYPSQLVICAFRQACDHQDNLVARNGAVLARAVPQYRLGDQLRLPHRGVVVHAWHPDQLAAGDPRGGFLVAGDEARLVLVAHHQHPPESSAQILSAPTASMVCIAATVVQCAGESTRAWERDLERQPPSLSGTDARRSGPAGRNAGQRALDRPGA